MKHYGYLLALLLSIPTFAAGAPPVEYPQACAPTYCVQIIATHPDQPQKFVIQHNAKMGTATMTVDMGRGFFVAFNSKYVESRLIHATSEKRRDQRDDSATAWSYLRCGATRGKDEMPGGADRKSDV